MKHPAKITALLLIIFPLLISACGNGTPTQDPAVIKTQSAQTVEAYLTQTALAVPATPTATSTESPTPQTTPGITDTPRPTNTPLITDTPLFTVTPFSTVIVPRTPQYSCDKFTYISDVTIPDGSTIQPGATFVKTWRIKNSGACSWTTDYKLVFGYGGEGTDWEKVKPVNFPNEVAPGGLMDISVSLTAPTTAGSYGAYFRPMNDKGTTFGEFIWLYIKVP